MKCKFFSIVWSVIFLIAAAAPARAETQELPQAEEGPVLSAVDPQENIPERGHPVTQEWLRAELKKVRDELTLLEENQKKILEGQDKLSEEHKQLRYWVHHR